MIVIIFPLIIMALSISILFNIDNPSQTAYIVVGLVNISMLSFMFFGTKFYQDNARKRQIIEFKQDIQSQIQNLRKRVDKLEKKQLQYEIDKINTQIKEFTSKYDEVDSEYLSIDDFERYS
jgi:peptidoglycan hydrolase CwlO-like protein